MDYNGSFIRWQSITITQLGFTTNLLFTITIAEIGFLIKAVTKTGFVLDCGEKYFFTIGLFLLIISFLGGIVINLTRLYDYRLTAKTARKRENNSKDPKLSSLRAKTDKLGKTTWCILWVQIITFGLGSLLIMITFLNHCSDKLF